MIPVLQISDGESNSFQSFSSPEIPDESNVFVLLSAVKHESSNLQVSKLI